ncbi:unnamed protein product, partial [Rotaria sp. Silwood2]
SSLDIIIDTIKKIMSYRDEIDSKEDAIDKQHDLPVYHRIQYILNDFISHINQFNNEKKKSFYSITLIFLQFDKTLAPLVGKLLIKIAQNKEDIEDGLKILEENLSKNYFERILTELSSFIKKTDSCPFIQFLNVDEKLNLVEWFIKEKNRSLLFLDLLINDIFKQSGVNREQCQNLLRYLRQSKNLFIKEQTMTYCISWEDAEINNDDQMSVSDQSSDSDIS